MRAAALVGLEIDGIWHIIDGSAVRHVFRNRGDPKTERARGQIEVTDADFERIPEILADPTRSCSEPRAAVAAT